MNSDVSWKNVLQEYCQGNRIALPVYETVNRNGTWSSTVHVNGISVKGSNSDRKSESEKLAAYQALKKLQDTSSSEENDDDDDIYEESSSEEEKTTTTLRINGRELVIQQTKNFPNNLLNDEFLNHLQLIVRSKSVDITNDVEYKSESPVAIYITNTVTEIISSFDMNKVKIKIPLIPNRESFQAMMILSACMELGADSCAIISIPSGTVNRVLLA